jgi:hypothetical protein
LLESKKENGKTYITVPPRTPVKDFGILTVRGEMRVSDGAHVSMTLACKDAEHAKQVHKLLEHAVSEMTANLFKDEARKNERATWADLYSTIKVQVNEKAATVQAKASAEAVRTWVRWMFFTPGVNRSTQPCP